MSSLSSSWPDLVRAGEEGMALVERLNWFRQVPWLAFTHQLPLPPLTLLLARTPIQAPP